MRLVRIATGAALTTLTVSLLTVNGIWWVVRTVRLVRVLEGHVLGIAFGQVVPVLWLWFTGLPVLLVILPVAPLWLGWQRRWVPAVLAAAAALLVSALVFRWGGGLFPLVPGPGGYYLRTLPFGE